MEESGEMGVGTVKAFLIDEHMGTKGEAHQAGGHSTDAGPMGACACVLGNVGCPRMRSSFLHGVWALLRGR